MSALEHSSPYSVGTVMQPIFREADVSVTQCGNIDRSLVIDSSASLSSAKATGDCDDFEANKVLNPVALTGTSPKHRGYHVFGC